MGVGEGSFTGWGMKGAFNSCLSVRKICNGMASFQMLQVLILLVVWKLKTKMYFVFKCTVYFSWQCHRFNSSCHCHENNMFILVQFFSCLIKNCMLWYMEKKKTDIVVLNWSLVRWYFLLYFYSCDAMQQSVLTLNVTMGWRRGKGIGNLSRGHVV